jgi:putative nucleotidyltransferase with HDIG domain
MAMNIGGVLGKALDGYGLKTGDLWRHSVAVACMAGQIASATGSDAIDDAYIAGLLHDIGKIILDAHISERRVLFDNYFSTYPQNSSRDAEHAIFGFDHAVIAALVCENWKLPRSISFSVRHHHQPSSAGDHQLSHIIHLADHVTNQAGMGADGKAGDQALDEASRSKVPLDSDTLATVAGKARQYVETLTG